MKTSRPLKIEATALHSQDARAESARKRRKAQNCKQKLRKAQSTAENAETPPEAKSSPLKAEIKVESSEQAEKLQKKLKTSWKAEFLSLEAEFSKLPLNLWTPPEITQKLSKMHLKPRNT